MLNFMVLEYTMHTPYVQTSLWPQEMWQKIKCVCEDLPWVGTGITWTLAMSRHTNMASHNWHSPNG